MKRILRVLAALGLWAISCDARAEPATILLSDLQPVETLDAFSPDECSISLWVKFGRAWLGGGRGCATGLFNLRLRSDGVPEAVFRAHPTELQGDYTMTGQLPVGRGEWHHYAFVYSRAEARAAFYLDGHLQWTDNNLSLPRLAPFSEAARLPTEGFRGRVLGLTVWDVALDAESLLPVGDEESDPTDTIQRQRHAERVARNLAMIGESAGPGVLYAVAPLDGAPVLPYDLPTSGVLSNLAEVRTIPGERALLSFVFVAKMPLTVRDVLVSDFRGSGAMIPSKACDIRLVKRLYRSQIANEHGPRALVPDLLVHDDGLVRVDEVRQRNWLRLTRASETFFVDDRAFQDPARASVELPFRDAESLQPVEIGEMGRNQQFVFAINVPARAEPGSYSASVRFLTTLGEVHAQLKLNILPMAIPSVPARAYDKARAFALARSPVSDARDAGLDFDVLSLTAENPIRARADVGWRAFLRGLDGVRLSTPLAYPACANGLPTLREEAVRAGYDDLRWVTRLRQLADRFEDAADVPLRTLARRTVREMRSFGADESPASIRREAQHRMASLNRAIRAAGFQVPPVRPIPGQSPFAATEASSAKNTTYREESRLLAAVSSRKGDAEWLFQSLTALGDFYLHQAHLAGGADGVMLRKALRCHEAALGSLPSIQKKIPHWKGAIETAFALKDNEKVASLLLDCRVLTTVHGNGTFQPSGLYARWTGDLAYARGDWEGAVRGYGLATNLDVPPPVHPDDETAWDRYAGALYATGRYQACLELLPRLNGRGPRTVREARIFENLTQRMGEKK